MDRLIANFVNILLIHLTRELWKFWKLGDIL